MRITGIVLTVIGFILLLIMLYSFVDQDQFNRGNLWIWTGNWAPILSFFILTSGVGLWYASTKRKHRNN